MSTSKIFRVANAVQAVLLSNHIINEIQNGFWAGQRPANHGQVWNDVQVIVDADSDVLGYEGFDMPRTYNLIHSEFFEASMPAMLALASTVREGITEARIKKELLELSQIIGKRILTRTQEGPLKCFRGNNRPGSLLVPTKAKKIVEASARRIRKTATKQDDSVAQAVNVATSVFDVQNVSVEVDVSATDAVVDVEQSNVIDSE